jgi:hypothetical protein
VKGQLEDYLDICRPLGMIIETFGHYVAVRMKEKPEVSIAPRGLFLKCLDEAIRNKREPDPPRWAIDYAILVLYGRRKSHVDFMNWAVKREQEYCKALDYGRAATVWNA